MRKKSDRSRFLMNLNNEDIFNKWDSVYLLFGLMVRYFKSTSHLGFQLVSDYFEGYPGGSWYNPQTNLWVNLLGDQGDKYGALNLRFPVFIFSAFQFRLTPKIDSKQTANGTRNVAYYMTKGL